MGYVKFDTAGLTKYVNNNIRNGLKEIGQDMVRLIRSSMVPGYGKVYKTKKGIHLASSPGSPPAPLTYRLHDSITYATTFGDKSKPGPRAQSDDFVGVPKKEVSVHTLSVGTSAPYGLAMEKGSKVTGLKARPYLWPALKKSRSIIKEALDRV